MLEVYYLVLEFNGNYLVMDHWNGIKGGKFWGQLCPLAFNYSDCSIPWQVSSGGILASLKLTGKTEDCQVLFNCSVACLDAVFELCARHSIPASLCFFFRTGSTFFKKFLWWLLFSFFSIRMIIVFYLILINGIVTRPLFLSISQFWSYYKSATYCKVILDMLSTTMGSLFFYIPFYVVHKLCLFFFFIADCYA